MARRKRKHVVLKPAAESPAANRAGRILFIGLVPIVALIAFAVASARNRSPEPRDRVERRAPHREPVASDAPPSEEERVEAIIEANAAMNRDFEQWFDVAEEIVGDDPQARTLIAFARSSAIPSMLMPGGITHFIVMGELEDALGNHRRLSAEPSETTPRAFEISVADMATRRAFGMGALADWQYDQGRNQLFVPPRSGYSRVYGAAVLLHELQHAYDICTGREPEHPTPDEWAEGEYRAYDVETRILALASDGATERYVEELLGRIRPPANSQWIAESELTNADYDRWDRALGDPPIHTRETYTRAGTLIVHLNRRLAEREGRTYQEYLAFIRVLSGHS